MGGKCESDKGNPVGCKLIQKMSSDIQKIKEIRHPFSGWSILIIAALVVIIAGILLASTFKSNSYPTEIRLDVRVDGGGAVSEKAKANIKLELSEALLAMEARAAAAYNEKFATLLTILTIFGIAWPVIIALLQFKFNEKELEKIEKAQDKAEESLKQAREAREKAQECLDDIPKTKMRISRCNGDLHYELAFFEARNCTDWSTKNQTEKEDILYRFAFSMESYIHAILAEKDNDNNIITVLLPKMDSICEKVKTIIPDMKSERLGQKFGSLVFLVGDIPGENPNKTKLRNQLEEIANELRENEVSEPQISEEGK